MKQKTVLQCFAALLLCSILVYPLAAQQQNCAPPVALPTSTEPNIFTDENEVYLGDAIAEHIQKYYRVIEDQEVTQYLTQIGERLTKYNQLIESAKRKPEAPRDREKGQMVADQAGLYALISAGYDPSALTRFWDRITGAKGKTGGWFSDLFGTTRPEERRLLTCHVRFRKPGQSGPGDDSTMQLFANSNSPNLA